MLQLKQSEFKSRIGKVREAMVQRGFDALIIYSDMRTIGGGNNFYFTNYHPCLSDLNFSVVVLPLKGEPCLIAFPGVQGASRKLAEKESWIKNIKGEPFNTWSVDHARHAREALEELNLTKGRIGMAGTEYMTKAVYERFVNELRGAKLEEATGLVEEVRFVKSPGEIALILEACRLADIGLEAFMAAAQPGRKQADAVAEAEYKAKLAGAESTNLPMSGGKPWDWGFFRGDRVFQGGDMVAMEFNAVYKGYFGQVCRAWMLGKPTDEQQRVYEKTFEASAQIAEMIKPGVSGEELWQIGMNVIKRAGYGYSQIRYGHGMGLTMAEGVDFAPGDKTVLKEGCYVMVHPNIFQPDVYQTGIGAIVGDAFLVTKTGGERITKARHQ